MSGKLFEWVADRHDPNDYWASSYPNPPGPDGGSSPILRGGSWSDSLMNGVLRASVRLVAAPLRIGSSASGPAAPRTAAEQLTAARA